MTLPFRPAPCYHCGKSGATCAGSDNQGHSPAPTVWKRFMTARLLFRPILGQAIGTPFMKGLPPTHGQPWRRSPGPEWAGVR